MTKPAAMHAKGFAGEAHHDKPHAYGHGGEEPLVFVWTAKRSRTLAWTAVGR